MDRLSALGGRRGSNGCNSNSSTSKETRKSRDRDLEPARLALRPQLRESQRGNYGHRVNSQVLMSNSEPHPTQKFEFKWNPIPDTLQITIQAGRARVVEWVGVKDKRGPKMDELLKLVPNQTQISSPKPLVQDQVDSVTDQEPIEHRSDVDDPQEAFGEDDPVGRLQVKCNSQLDVQKSTQSRPCDTVEADGVSNTSSDVEELVPVDTSSLSLVRVDLAKEVLAPHRVEGDVREMGACLGQDLVDHP